MSTTTHSHITQLSSWFPKSIPTSTSLSSIDISNAPALWSSILSASSVAQTATGRGQFYTLSRVVRGAEASLTIISAQQYIATATQDIYKPIATQLIFNATLNLQNLETASSIYGTKLDMSANVIFTVVFMILFIYHAYIGVWSKNHYFGVAFICGTGLEWVGYLARALSVHDDSDIPKFLCQIICLTMAPAFIMGGIYYLLAQLLVIHRSDFKKDYSIFKPLWFSYIFVFCDVVSLLMQAIGGAVAATSLEKFKDTLPGTHIMVAGIAFQVFTMTLFLFLLFHFLFRIFFRANPNIRFSFRNLYDILFQTKNGKTLTANLDPFYNPSYVNVRQTKLFPYFPLVMIFSVLFIYIRCIYRVIELSQGWRGYLIVHEAFVMTLDALMVFLSSVMFVPFHPVFLFGKRANLSLKVIKQGTDIESDNLEKSHSPSSSKLSSSNSVEEHTYAPHYNDYLQQTPEQTPELPSQETPSPNRPKKKKKTKKKRPIIRDADGNRISTPSTYNRPRNSPDAPLANPYHSRGYSREIQDNQQHTQHHYDQPSNEEHYNQYQLSSPQFYEQPQQHNHEYYDQLQLQNQEFYYQQQQNGDQYLNTNQHNQQYDTIQTQDTAYTSSPSPQSQRPIRIQVFKPKPVGRKPYT